MELARGRTTARVPLTRVIADPRENIYMQANDVLTLVHDPQTFLAFGATGVNTEIPFNSDGITLAQALVKAGGLQDPRSDPQGVFIFRYENAIDRPTKWCRSVASVTGSRGPDRLPAGFAKSEQPLHRTEVPHGQSRSRLRLERASGRGREGHRRIQQRTDARELRRHPWPRMRRCTTSKKSGSTPLSFLSMSLHGRGGRGRNLKFRPLTFLAKSRRIGARTSCLRRLSWLKEAW